MADIVIINPSPNMRTVARELSTYGKRVELVSVSGLPYVTPKRVFYFFAGYNVCFTEDAQGEAEKEDRVFMFKRSVISRFRMWGVSKALDMLSPELAGGSFTDLIMFRRGMLRCDSRNNALKKFSSAGEVRRSYPDAKIVSSAAAGVGSLKLCRWETDFDLAETFGSDYFVFFGSGSRLEAFCSGGELFTLSREKNHAGQFAKIIPSAAKFAFRQTDEKSVMRNPYPWIINSRSPKITLVNDYSLFGVSVDMPSSWYGRLAAALNYEKSK